MNARTQKKDGAGKVLLGLQSTLENLQAERHTGAVAVEIFMKHAIEQTYVDNGMLKVMLKVILNKMPVF